MSGSAPRRPRRARRPRRDRRVREEKLGPARACSAAACAAAQMHWEPQPRLLRWKRRPAVVACAPPRLTPRPRRGSALADGRTDVALCSPHPTRGPKHCSLRAASRPKGRWSEARFGTSAAARLFCIAQGLPLREKVVPPARADGTTKLQKPQLRRGVGANWEPAVARQSVPTATEIDQSRATQVPSPDGPCRRSLPWRPPNTRPNLPLGGTHAKDFLTRSRYQ